MADILSIPDLSVFAQFGIAGMILGVFFVMVLILLRVHERTIKGVVQRMSTDAKDNNDAWRATFTEHSNRADVRQQETNTVLRELSKVIHER